MLPPNQQGPAEGGQRKPNPTRSSWPALEVPSRTPAHLCAVWGHIEDKKGPLLRPGRLGAFSNSVLSHIEVVRSLLLFRELDWDDWTGNGGREGQREHQAQAVPFWPSVCPFHH